MHLEALTSRQKRIFNKLKEFPEYYLAGGTALALQIGHRLSIDFDFFYDKDIPPELLLKIQKVFKGSKIKVIVNHPEQLTVIPRGINLTFLKYPFPPIFGLKNCQGVRLLSIPEIAAAKAYSLGRRATLKDYVDLYYILKEKHLSLEKLIKIVKRKYKEFDQRLFLEQLIYFEDVEDIEIKFLKRKVSKKEIENFFQNQVKKIKL